MGSTSNIRGQGMLFVKARISRPDLMDYDTYMKWYDEDHIAEILETSGVQSAYRYINENKSATWPYLAFYPMDDVAFTLGDEFRKIRVKSDLLPGTGICYDLADNDVRYLGLTGKSGIRRSVAQYLLLTGFEPGPSTSEADAEKWLETTQKIVSKIPGYQRTTRWRLLYARSNAQSRALKGLPSTDEPSPEPPSWETIHEFDRPIDESVFDAVRSAKGSSEVLSDAKEIELIVYKLAKAFGEKQFFD